MGKKIIVCGGNGAGKSTLGNYLAKQLHCKFMDIEDYCFPENRLERPYEEARTREEVTSCLLADLRRYDTFVLAAVKGSYGYEVDSLFTCAVLVEAPREVRMKRVRERSFRKFGNRILPGGDLYEKEEQFFDRAGRRSVQEVEDWLTATGLPVIRVDGTRPLEENAAWIVGLLEGEH